MYQTLDDGLGRSEDRPLHQLSVHALGDEREMQNSLLVAASVIALLGRAGDHLPTHMCRMIMFLRIINQTLKMTPSQGKLNADAVSPERHNRSAWHRWWAQKKLHILCA